MPRVAASTCGDKVRREGSRFGPKNGVGSTQGGTHVRITRGRLEGETDRAFLLIAVLPVINDLP